MRSPWRGPVLERISLIGDRNESEDYTVGCGDQRCFEQQHRCCGHGRDGRANYWPGYLQGTFVDQTHGRRSNQQAIRPMIQCPAILTLTAKWANVCFAFVTNMEARQRMAVGLEERS